MDQKKYNEKKIFSKSQNLVYGPLAIFMTACGGNKGDDSSENQIGYSSAYIPPANDYVTPEQKDPYFKLYEPAYNDPYWVDALLMDGGAELVTELIISEGRLFQYSFPADKPSYIPVTILGWAPANEKMVSATSEIFYVLDEVLNISFKETETETETEIETETAAANAFNVIAISQSIQSNSAGFSYFPNKFYELGSDVFISKTYSNPYSFDNGLTNYDYEVLIHEIGHALGLKHPFDPDGHNTVVLENFEDNTRNTVMSYTDYSFTFDGNFRALDWMALTKLYGVNPTYKPEDNTYKFSNTSGMFIIDGGGIDLIDCSASHSDVFIDLREGAHSYEGSKSIFITAARQLTISSGSEIENVKTGSGNDTIVGNSISNFITSSLGDDIIFAGDGEDYIKSGPGHDIIDLSESKNFQDIIGIENDSLSEGIDTIYGFVQGLYGDIIDFVNFNFNTLKYLPLVSVVNVPNGYIDNCIVRVFGENLDEPSALENKFNTGGVLSGLQLSDNTAAFLITSNSKDTGVAQNLYEVENKLGYINVTTVAHFFGNYLDIDSWSAENFTVSEIL